MSFLTLSAFRYELHQFIHWIITSSRAARLANNENFAITGLEGVKFIQNVLLEFKCIDEASSGFKVYENVLKNIGPYVTTKSAAAGGELYYLGVILAISADILILATFGETIVLRNRAIIRKASINMSFIMMVALFICTGQLYVMVDTPTPALCIMDAFFLPVAFSLYYGTLFMKTLRIYKIFNGSRTGVGLRWTDFRVGMVSMLFPMPVLIIVIAWIVVDAPKPLQTNSPLSVLDVFWTCRSTNPDIQTSMVYVLIIYNALILLANLVMAIRSRNIKSDYNETKAIGMSVYTVTFVSIISVPVIFSQSIDFSTRFLVKALIIWYMIIFNLIIMFINKVYKILIEELARKGKGGRKGKRSSDGKGESAGDSEGKSGEMCIIQHFRWKNDADSKGWAHVAHVYIRRLDGYHSFVSEFSQQYLAAAGDASQVALFECRNKKKFPTISLEGVAKTWMLRYLTSFDSESYGDKGIKIFIADQVYIINFSDSNSRQIMLKFFSGWGDQKRSTARSSDQYAASKV